MKLNYKRTFFVGLAFLSISAFWQMYDSIIPLILQNTFHLPDAVTGAIMAIDNVLAVFLLPIIGTLSDKVDTRWGKRTPFIVGGTIAAVIFMMLMPMADMNKQLILFIVALAFTLLSMAMYRSPSVALMPDLTPKPLRSSANAVINLMGAIGAVYTLILIQVLVKKEDHPSYLPVFIGVAAIMIIAIVVLLLTIKEKKLAAQIAEEYPEEEQTEIHHESGKLPKDVKKSLILILASIFLWFTAYNAVTTAFSRYAITVWKMEGGGFASCLMVATIAAICSYIPIGVVASKSGRKKTILVGLLFMLISYTSVFFYPTYHWSANFFFALIGVGWAAVGVNSLPMVVEMSKDSDIGKYTGLYYTFSMSAQIVTPILSGLLLQHISYNTLFPYAMFFTVCAMITMSQVKHGDAKPIQKENVLENFDVED
ncbi:MAG: MFS transporter [Agathobacter sp.]|nr:MFS transporter [Agathobacter sp.]MBQ2283808.1 MFS transporter [Agathobacter sp.]